MTLSTLLRLLCLLAGAAFAACLAALAWLDAGLRDVAERLRGGLDE
jgi:hypothetical protein